jgi:indolepyruvate ferredoxin oxidoreductase alpha subunit
LTTRVCHSSTAVELATAGAGLENEEELTTCGHEPPAASLTPPEKFPRNPAKYIMIPAHARKRHPIIEERIRLLADWAEGFSFNRIEWGGTGLGIVTCGVAYEYAREVFPDASFLRLGMTYPLPPKRVREFASRVERLIVVEELDPFLEEEIKLMGVACEGKSIFPMCGEFDPRVVRESAIRAGLLPETARVPVAQLDKPEIPPRPPVLCPGCTHRGVFHVLSKLRVPVTGDIGCYTLGLLPPLSAVHTCGCMGASIGVAHGAAQAGIGERMVAVIGDSTFFHTGMPALANVAYNQSNVVTLILDNRTTGMTGHQQNPGTGWTLQLQETLPLELEPLVQALGIQRVKTVPAYDVQAIEDALKESLKAGGPSVLIVRGECVLLPSARKRWLPLRVLPDQCNGCTMCFRVGCPAVLKSDQVDIKTQRPKATIDQSLCTGCEVCAQVCPWKAILFRDQVAALGETSAREGQHAGKG